MTVKEAIKVLEDFRRYLNCTFEDEHKAIDIAINVLEKVSLIQFNVFALNELLNESGGTNNVS